MSTQPGCLCAGRHDNRWGVEMIRRAAWQFLLLTVVSGVAAGTGLPVRDPLPDGYIEGPVSVTNLYSQEMLLRCVGGGDAKGLTLDLTREPVLLDGTTVDPTRIGGRAWIAPYPFAGPDTRWDVYQFLSASSVRGGAAALDISRLHNDVDPEWGDRGQVVVRLDLSLAQEGADRPLGTYEFLLGFSREAEGYRKAVTVTEGPFVGPIRSDAPDRVIIFLRTDPEAVVTVTLREKGTEAEPGEGGTGAASQGTASAAAPRGKKADAGLLRFDSGPTREHEIALTGLRADTDYAYRVEAGGWKSDEYAFHTAPPKGAGPVRFAFAGDSRQGVGGGTRAFMGVDALILDRELEEAYRQDVAFWVHGGDLVNGYTTVPEDFRTQLRAFKWAASSFLHERPIYCGVGNHDALIRQFERKGSGGGSSDDLVLDRWPYETESSEAVFADEFVNPENGPATGDPRRPAYLETVYSFQYGLVRIIMLNNNYWVSTNPEAYGGSPEGWFFPEQMDWLREELERADSDPTVAHVLICTHEPVFPNGAHLDDAMWYEGDNRVRAYSVGSASPGSASSGSASSGSSSAGPASPGSPSAGSASAPPRPEGPGLIDVRNDLARMAAGSRKVAAVLTSDEHNYSRVLIAPNTPAGDPVRDDRDGDGKLDAAELSVIPGLQWPIWYLISGGGGAPIYADETSPWSAHWRAHPEKCPAPEGCYRFSMLFHWLLFEADRESISLEVYSDRGELIERVENLKAVGARATEVK